MKIYTAEKIVRIIKDPHLKYIRIHYTGRAEEKEEEKQKMREERR
jgi:hypothetical protein